MVGKEKMSFPKSDKSSSLRENVPDKVSKDKRLKKRELDRRAQRMARERTKNRITHLEAMVAHLKQSDASARTQSLMDHLSQVTMEKERLLNVLESLNFTIRGHIEDSTRRNGCLSPSVPDNVPSLSQSSFGTRVIVPTYSRPTYPTQIDADTCNDALDPQLWIDTLPQAPAQCQALPEENVFGEVLNSLCSMHAISIPPTLSDPLTTDTYQADDVIIPATFLNCYCTGSAPQGDCAPDFNLWRAVNEVLARPSQISQAGADMYDATSEDIIIRAIVEGWDSVEGRGAMTDFWRNLREIDELGWEKTQPTERLAVLKFISLMMAYNCNPTPDRQAFLPQLLRARPSQTIPHTRAIDFFAWPALRERFVFFQHQYCANRFWHLAFANLKIRWPFDFRDTYMKNTETDQFQISPRFAECIFNSDSWTMRQDFLDHFPELYDDIPVYPDTFAHGQRQLQALGSA